MSAESVFYTGTVPEAISRSQAEKRPLVVFLKGSDPGSGELEKAFLSDPFKPVVTQAFVLLLLDDLEDTEDTKYTNARLFRQLFPVSQLPAVFMLGMNGVSLVTLKGSISAEDLLSQLTEGLDAYQSQVDQAQATRSETETQSRSTVSDPSPSGRGTTQPAPSPVVVQPAPVSAPVAPPEPVAETREKPVVKKVRKPKRQEVTKPPPPPVYTSTVIRFRLTNDDVIENEFPVDATLREICSYVDVHRTDGGVPYVLETMYPRQSLGESRYSETLKELDLVPRTTVRLMPLKGGHSALSGAAEGDGQGSLLSTVYSGVGSMLGYLSSFVFSPPSEHPAPPDTSSGDSQRDSRVSETTVSNSDDSRVRRRSAWGGNVHGLRDRDENIQDPSANAFWNGNSTQYGGEENTHED